MTNKFTKLDQDLAILKVATGADLSGGEIAKKVLAKINYLRNWRYSQPIFTRAGADAPVPNGSNTGELYPILRNITKRDTANPDRYFAIVADPMTYFDGDDGFAQLGWRSTHATSTWHIVNHEFHSSVTTGTTVDYTEFPESGKSIVATQGDLQEDGDPGPTGVIQPLTVTPSVEYEVARISYFGMAFRALSLFEIPNPNLTATQAGCSQEEVSKDAVIRGDVTTRKNTFGALFDILGNDSDTADTIERATRRHWQWCHPFGVYLSTGTGASVDTLYNILGNTTVKFKPRQIFNDDRKVKVTVKMVVTADDGIILQASNNTLGTTGNLNTSGASSGPTLVTLSDLRVQRGIQNHLEFRFLTTSAAEAVKVHSIAVFEEDPFDSVA